ncbi:protein-glutamate O-methyltransferase CheR [Herbaspirillum sp. RTI4]|uniref:CheR family methyltransferase n=1 Tax=Herbaspirillum sp. RTI4 TaxID=3048640 RepID=UPI002AB4A962|nr:protein-glutamate O-methyltransferase CheR [Herbaspirillum sp. RTI4]MDY7578089.1 protein-glutamate O-methyltransferase CheR [Herbaspirillum sp. RTI4]MEA9980678.1 protein-glutamate O-methyltransferase CheR [Herbaspirillum sp. RTI4]
MELNSLDELEFATIRDWLFDKVGIALTSSKKALICSRLFKRVQTAGLDSYGAYFAQLVSDQFPEEAQVAINLLTTNETYFFREPKHFDMLSEIVEKAPRSSIFRVWSAACSTGEEVYSIAMTLAELQRVARAPKWEVRGSDVSTRVLEVAQGGHYGLERTESISPTMLKRYCLSGTGPYEGTLLIDRSLRDKTAFAQINLIEPLPHLIPFNVIFLRNVLIYFDPPVKRKIVTQLLDSLTPDGVLFVGMAETLNGLIDGLVTVGPGAYRRDRRG